MKKYFRDIQEIHSFSIISIHVFHVSILWGSIVILGSIFKRSIPYIPGKSTSILWLRQPRPNDEQSKNNPINDSSMAKAPEFNGSSTPNELAALESSLGTT